MTDKIKAIPARRHKVDLRKVAFNPAADDLNKSWCSGAAHVVCVNAFPNGITISQHSPDRLPEEENRPEAYHLRVRDMREYRLPGGKYYLYRENYAQGLEQHLSHLHQQGILGQTVVYFGTTSDAFLAFQKKFDVTMACLELLEQYRPGFIVVQTRSPMVISALPLLKMLGEKVVVAIPMETHQEAIIQRYTPGQPKVSERLIAANGLRRQEIKVNLVVSPMLPYGDFYSDAWNFAELLENHSDYVSFGCLASGHPSEEAHLKGMAIAQRLAAEKMYQWLRPHCYRNVYYALTLTAPEKLQLPLVLPQRSSQLTMFAA